MEENFIEEKKAVKRMKQVFIAGGNYVHPSEFSKVVNKNIKVLMESDRNCEILDIQFSVQNHPQYINHGMVYLAFIVAEVDIIEKEADEGKKKHKKKHKKDK